MVCVSTVPFAGCGRMPSRGTYGLSGEPVLNEQRLPSDVLAYVSLTNVKDLKEKWNSTQFGKLDRRQGIRRNFWNN